MKYEIRFANIYQLIHINFSSTVFIRTFDTYNIKYDAVGSVI